ncbi:MAG: hypothetical protein LBB75_01570 [Oscillospiraceae bacterium]|jgi:hypothetical protein|nr:hypothetical protein [Oscillospiraceae bacterium]
MNKATKRILAALLAALMVLGVSTAAAAAPSKSPRRSGGASTGTTAAAPADPAGTLAIKTQPSSTSFKLYEESPDLAGLVVTAQGGGLAAATDVSYDAVFNLNPAKGRILWSFYVEPADSESWWVEGENDAVLYVYGYQCTEFHRVEKVGGVWYGTFDEEIVFYGNTGIKVTATVSQSSRERTLTLDKPEKVNYDGWNPSLFKFTAPRDGYYKFFSEGGKFGGTLYSEAGDEYEKKSVDPWAYLLGEDYDWLGDDDDSGGDLNFAMYRQMKANEVVYMYAGGYSEDPISYTVSVTRLGDKCPALPLKKTEIKAVFHEYIDIDALLDGGLTIEDVRCSYDWEYFDSWWYNVPYGIKRGTTNITIQGPNGEVGTVKVKIDYSFEQWMCAIFLGGWAWLKYTGIGPFNLADEIRNLFDYGVVDSLRVLVRDWIEDLYYLI